MFCTILGTAAIILIWVLFIGMGLPTWAAIVLTVVASFIILVGLLFLVYFFNLDMKLLAALSGPFSKIYDKRKRHKDI